LLSALFPAAAARFDTCNLLADLSGPGAADWSPHLVLMAHVDTKSQNISIVARIVSVAGGLLLTLLFCLLLALAALFPTLAESSLLRLISSALLIADIGLALALLGLSVHNESPGALDNGGSCAVLLQTAAVLAERPELAAGVRVSFAFTGGEELGLAGSRALVGRARELLGPPERLLVLNLDGVGAPGDAVLTSETGLIPRGRSAELMRLVGAAAERRGLRLRLLKTVVGGEADHIPFQEAGVQAVSLAHFSRHTLAVHTALDTLDKVDPQRLAQAHELILAVLEQLRPPAPAATGAEGACSTLTMSPKA